MPLIHYIQPDGQQQSVQVKAGITVMQAAIHNNVRGIEAECGGCLSCATCHVYIDPSSTAELSAPDDAEEELLEGVAAERRPESRLSCQLVVASTMSGLVVRIPEKQG